MTKEEIVVNTVHNKVNKEDIYLIGIMKKLLTDLGKYFFGGKENWYWGGHGFGLFILNKKEKYLFQGSKLSNIYLNYYKNNQGEKNGRILEYELSDEYTLYVYCLGYSKNEINKIMKENILTLQSVFRDNTLKVFQQKLVDIFGIYGCYTIILMLAHYLKNDVIYKRNLFGTRSVKKDLGKLGGGDVTIDISILESIIKEGKEKFKDKLDLLYLLLSNINKTHLQFSRFSSFFYFLKDGIEKFKLKDKDIEKQDSNGEFQTYTIKIHYLCSYLFKEFFDDYVYGGPKKLFSFYTYTLDNGVIYDSEKDIEEYKNFDLEYFKKVALIIDQKVYKKFS